VRHGCHNWTLHCIGMSDYHTDASVAHMLRTTLVVLFVRIGCVAYHGIEKCGIRCPACSMVHAQLHVHKSHLPCMSLNCMSGRHVGGRVSVATTAISHDN
jgi:hypothetical protein